MLIRFVLSGTLVAAIDLCSYGLLYAAGAEIYWANVIGMTNGFLAGYFLHKTFTFSNDSPHSLAMFCRYILAFLVNLVIGHSALMTLLRWFDDPYLIKIITMIIVFFSNYLISRYWVFNK